MPGVAYILTAKNAPKTYPMPEELFFQGEVVAIVAAETEDQAEDAVAAIRGGVRNSSVLRPASQQAMAPNRRTWQQEPPENVVKTLSEWGDVDKAFAQSDVVKEFTYFFGGAIPVPISADRLRGQVGWRQADHLGHAARYLSVARRRTATPAWAIPCENVRFIDKWNGGTFGGADAAGDEVLSVDRAHLPKQTDRPVKMMLTKDQELAHPAREAADAHQVQGRSHEGRQDRRLPPRVPRQYGRESGSEGSEAKAEAGPSSTCTSFPTGRRSASSTGPITMRTGASRSNSQQEFKWAWEQMMDEMAEAVGMDPVKFRLLNVQKPGTKVAIGQGGPTIVPMPETENGFLHLRLLCLGRGSGRRREGHRVGQEESRARRQSRKIQARNRRGDVPASRRARGLPGRRAGFRLDHVQIEPDRARSSARRHRC